jgi:putative ABC transport system ATP-binding protein
MSRVVDARGLRRVYGEKTAARAALEGVDLCVDSGEFLTIVGPSGSGKSTLLSILGGLDTGYQGSLHLFGMPARTLSDRQMSQLRGDRFGFVFQSFCLVDTLSVLDNVMLPALFARKQRAESSGVRALQRVGLSDRAADRAEVLSGGQRQRVAIARAIAHDPEIVLCDEPTGNLDVDTAARIIELLAELNRGGMTVICATHEARIAKAATRRLQLQDGRLSQSDVGQTATGESAQHGQGAR